MKLKTLAISLLVAVGTHAEDPLSQHLVAPRAVFQHAGQIGLTPEQAEKIKAAVESVHRQNPGDGEQKLEAATRALSAELANNPIDTAAALEKLDAILAAESAMKHRHLTLLIAVSNELTPDQRQKLQSIKQPGTDRPDEPAAVTEKRLKSKIQRLSQIAERLAAGGQSPKLIHDMMQVFTSHMEKGQVRQAEKLLDQTLEKLTTKETSAITPSALKQQIDAMRVEDVAWRKIAWKTCLLDGIQASREQNKPIALWVFIDRPTDDKRC